MKVNEKLIWDYEFDAKEREGKYFRRWYLARVLTRGGIRDIKDVGLDTIHHLLPSLFLPREIRTFWEWFFSLPDIQKRYGRLNTTPEDIPS